MAIDIAYSGRSKPSALKLAEVDDDINIIRKSTTRSDINWGRATASSQLNPDISNVTNKRIMRELFRDNDVPMPKLLTFDEAIAAIMDGKKVVGRPDRHTKGRGLWICETAYNLRKAREGTARKQAATHFMEYVDAPKEFRVHVFLGKSIRISEKLFEDETRKSYTTIKPTGKKAKLREAAKAAVAAVGLDFGAVDILSDGERVWVLEVNAAPGLGGSMPQLYVDTFKKWKSGDF